MATEEVVCDPSLCTNPDSPGECCGDSFEHKTTPGLCGKCYIVLTSSDNADKMKDWPQCQGCSAVYKLLKAPRCGTCVKKDPQIAPSGPVPPLNPQDLNRPPNQSVTDKLQDLQAENRRNAMLARTLHKGSQKTSGAASSVIVGVAKGAPRQITVYLAPGTANTRTDASRILGNATRSFPEDIAMNDMLTHLLRHWNLDWEKDCDESLGPEHISLRLHGNVAIQPHSTAGSLGQFFDIHDRIHGNNPKKILQGPNTLKLPAPAVYLEGLILVKEFEDKTGAVAPRFVYSEKENRKRKGSEAGRTMGSNVKRIRSQTNISAAPVPLRSEIGDLPGFSKISFVFASVSVDRDGTVNIEWPAPTATPTVCILQDTPVAQGKTKKVYKVICEGMPWVAKRFFEIGAGDEQVEIQQNADFLVQEATRLGKTGYYLGQFIAEAKRRNTSIDDTIAVTEFKLGLEVVADDSAPSPASGISLEAYRAADPSTVQVLWLFEPRRSSAVDHWSGTNEYPPWHQNKLGSTLNAFAHYVYQISQETTVIADLQTSKAVNEQGDGINVLFDMMLHTTNGASGVGDHGQNGIDTFVAKHECVRRCVGLRLDQEGFENALKGLEDGDSAVEDDD